MSDLSLHNLSKTYAGARAPALSDLSLDVPSGGIVALLGPSGCGKSTALRLIAGLERPSSGDVRIGGQSVAGLAPEARSAVMVHQNHLLFPHMSVAQNVGFGLRMQGARDIGDRVAQMLDRVQLSAQASARPAMLSGGQAQRAALARALILRPRVLLLDEPLASLDPHLRADMRDLIAQVQAEMGITTVLVTHDQAEAVQLAPRIALMMQGRLCQFGPPRDFYDRPASMAVARFFGGVNFLPARVVAGKVRSALGDFPAQGAWVGAGHVTIRPEAVQITAPSDSTIAAHLTTLKDLGEVCRALVKTEGGVSLEVSVPTHQAPDLHQGQLLHLSLPSRALWFIPQGADE
jgi:ABC-type Fe3+/spermidine/putrescine transport system ATPase subunit